MDRTKSIGASEVASLFNESPYCSLYTLYCRKAGLLEEQETTKRQQIGKDLEVPILQIWSKSRQENDDVVEHNSDEFMHPYIKGLHATPDGVIKEKTNNKILSIVEVKTVNHADRKRWLTSGIPRHYWWQVQTQMMVLGVSHAHLVALFSVDEICEERIEADGESHKKIEEEANKFWMMMRGELPPPSPGSSDSSTQSMMKMERDDSVAVLGVDEWEKTNRIMEIKNSIKNLQSEENRLRNEILFSMGSSKRACMSDGSSWEVVETKRKSYSVKESTSKTLKYTKGENAE